MPHSTAPRMSITRCISAVRRALMSAPSALRSTGIAPPTATPSTIGNAAENVIAPVTLSACRMPMAAADDWMIAVNTMPTRMPSRGLEKFVSSDMNAAFSLSGATDALMISMPVIRIVKPSRIVPTLFFIGVFWNLRR